MILLATWLWQGLALAFATSVLLRNRRTFGAATRHAIWWLALVAVALLPCAYLLPRTRPPVAAPVVEHLPIAPLAVPLPAPPAVAADALLASWGLLLFAGLLRIGTSVRAVRRLKATSVPLDRSRVARLRMWNSLDRGRRVPELRVSRGIRAACALGLGRPVILLSPAVLALEDDRLDAVVMHEHAHLSRFDDWTQLAQATVSSLLAIHPAVWFIGNRIHLEREAACDDLVVSLGAAPREYARSLIQAAGSTPLPRWSTVAIPGAGRSAPELRRRVARLLDPTLARDRRVALPAAAACAASLALAVGLSANVPAVVVFVESQVPAPQVMALPWGTGDVAVLSPLAPPAALDERLAPGRISAPAASTVTSVPPPSAALAPTQASPPVSDLAPLTNVTASVRAVPERLDPVRIAQPPAPAPAAMSKSPPGSAESWTALARTTASAGKATGGGMKAAGTSIGRFFGRAGKSLAASF